MHIRRFLVLVTLASGAFCALAQPPSAGKIRDLFARLQTAQAARAAGRQPARVAFQLTEAEINEYMGYALKATPRPGLQSVTVKFFPYNYVSTYTVVDFDAIEKWKPGTVPMLLRPVLNGRKAVWVDYRFRAANGATTFSVEKAYFQNMRIPAFAVEKMIEVVAARQPEHYDTSKPVPLPFGLRQVATGNHSVSGEN